MEVWRPIFIIVLFVIVLWHELNCVKIPQGEANKSANRWGNLRAKGGVVPHSVFNLHYSCEHQIKSSHSFAAHYFVSTEATFKNLFTSSDPYTHQGLSSHSTLKVYSSHLNWEA
jgi:hypothetical protein